MGKHYSEELKNEIVQNILIINGTLNSLEKGYGISYKTIFNWLRKYKKTGSVANIYYKKRGRPKEKDIDYRERYEILKKYQTFIKAQREKK